MINKFAYKDIPKTNTVRIVLTSKFKQLYNKYYYDDVNNVFVTTIFDPKTKADISLHGTEFKKRIQDGYIYDNTTNILTKPSKKSEKALKDSIAIHDLTIVNNKDPIVQMKELDKRIKVLILKALKKYNGLKFNIGMDMLFSKPDKDNSDLIITQLFHIAAKSVEITHESQINQALKNQNEEIKRRIDRYTVNGSGWTIEEIQRHYIMLAKYKPLAAKSYIPLPAVIQNKKATINIKNTDDKCFMYCLGRALDPNPEKCHLELVSKHLKAVCKNLGLEDIKMPVSVKDIPKIETQFKISINIFGLDGTDVFPITRPKAGYDKHVDLLYIEDEKTNHYVLIKDFDKLNCNITKHKEKQHLCRYCMQHFTTKEILEKHVVNCIMINGVQAVEMPKEKTEICFSSLHKSIPCPFVIIADIEALLIKFSYAKNNCNKSYTIKKHKHESCSVGYKVICFENDKLSKPIRMFRCTDAVTNFFEALFEEEKEIIDHMKKFKKSDIIMTKTQYEEYNLAKACYVCQGLFTEDNKKVRDHCHVSGAYRGAAHDKCNLKLRLSPEIPIIFHNLKGYDTHHLMLKIGELNKNINIVPNNMEKYISFSIGTVRKEWDSKSKKMVDKERFNLRFIDSFSFLNESLSQLVDNLKESGLVKFKYTHEAFGSRTNMMTRKGVYPYAYMDSWSKFDVNPKKLKLEDFTNDLTGEKISELDFKHFGNVCDEFNIKNLGEYHDLYLKTDILLLADVFENFRKLCLSNYKLDPCHYFTAPGLAWDACLKMTEIKLELLTDVDMHLFIEKGMRGGVSIITHRKGAANNMYMKNPNPNEPTSYIAYYDANNLYGWAMTQSMPYGGFRWISPEEFILRSYEELCSNQLEKGYIVECDIAYNSDLHDIHNDYPYCPEQMLINPEMLSEYSLNAATRDGSKSGKFTKLIPNLNNKEKYVIHERNLRQAVDAGLKITKIHRVLEFSQKPWMKPYIDFNTEMRKQAKNDFEKNFYKFMNNSPFGKTMENVRKRVNVKLITDEKKLTRYVSKPTYISSKIFTENLVAVHSLKEKLTLNKPVYVGFAILDISKTLMYDFHYGFIKNKYGNKAKLLFTDTDSLCYEIETKDVYQDMYNNKEMFDLSDITSDRFKQYYDGSNKKVIGKFKPEYVNCIIEDFIGLRSKMYSLKFDKGDEVKKAKGIVHSVTERDIKHDMYRETLETGAKMHHNMTVIRSNKHQLYTMEINKVSLSAYDDKRWIMKDGISSYAHGHYKTRLAAGLTTCS
jgi:hypothetical protein